jgi:hypothetical protein
MSETDVEALQKAGANARAFGRSEFDNPYYKTDNLPATTREPLEKWAVKAEAWHVGWVMENAIRGQ